MQSILFLADSTCFLLFPATFATLSQGALADFTSFLLFPLLSQRFLRGRWRISLLSCFSRYFHNAFSGGVGGFHFFLAFSRYFRNAFSGCVGGFHFFLAFSRYFHDVYTCTIILFSFSFTFPVKGNGHFFAYLVRNATYCLHNTVFTSVTFK